MRSIELKSIPETVSEDSLRLYPDFLIGCLLKSPGLGQIEADRAQERNGAVDFILTPGATGVPSVIATIGSGYFRSVLAKMGGRFSSDLLYGGHTLFSCDFERDGKIQTHRFSLFTCNYQNTGYWMRLYLYSISEVTSEGIKK